MNRIIKIYKPFCFIEIMLGLIATAILLYNRPVDIAAITVVALLYLSIVTSLVIGIKLTNATEHKIRLSDEMNIVGHIGNCIKLLVMTGVLISAIYFFTATIHVVTIMDTRMILYYASMILSFIWIIVSLFTFAVYIVIARMNKRIRFSEVDDIGADINRS